TNGDELLDASDTYWNEGEGWIAIGNSSNRFEAVFDGNGYSIHNLMINRSDSSSQGLFGYIDGATIQNLGLQGPLMSVTARSNVGGLVGSAVNSTLTEVFSTGRVESTTSSLAFVGGLVGYLSSTELSACFATGAVSAAGYYVGGLVGYATASTISDCFATGAVAGDDYLGSLVGQAWSVTSVASRNLSTGGGAYNSNVGYFSGTRSYNYWWTDSTTRSTGNAGSGAALAELQCPTSADNNDCTSVNLYVGWAEALTNDGEPRWDFGTATQLPGLRISGVIYRDSDGDGALDGDDVFPNNIAASVDSDGDGAPDAWSLGCDSACRAASGLTLDQVPASPAAIADADLDGLPDAWAEGCDASCQGDSGLTLDAYPKDTDNDGLSNAEDTDDNNDGIPDADADADGLIDITSWAELDAIRYSLKGYGQQLSADGELDSSGCPAGVINGVAAPV
ncbi:GLUG motif-containing protein, partial [Teredinibacter waterburyi]|uniref:GLUG motif-containing protein n=1 Tax=Teredinibacter waterburyi TaxID=1500538 RepID=UPI002481A961